RDLPGGGGGRLLSWLRCRMTLTLTLEFRPLGFPYQQQLCHLLRGGILVLFLYRDPQVTSAIAFFIHLSNQERTKRKKNALSRPIQRGGLSPLAASLVRLW
ncbi:unnamed protein product, partial [Discosporangium mesarthrocarpum]